VAHVGQELALRLVRCVGRIARLGELGFGLLRALMSIRLPTT
jgi:hypothetical protein